MAAAKKAKAEPKPKAEPKRKAEFLGMRDLPAKLPKKAQGRFWPKGEAEQERELREAEAFLASRKRAGEDSTHNLWVAFYLGIAIEPGSAKGIGGLYRAMRDRPQRFAFRPMHRAGHFALPKREREAKAKA